MRHPRPKNTGKPANKKPSSGSGRPDRSDRPDRPSRPERNDRSDRNDRPRSDQARPDRPRGERPAKGDRIEKLFKGKGGRAERPVKEERKEQPEQERLPPEVRLPQSLVDAWRETLIKISKLPPGTNPRDENRNALAGRILQSQTKDISELWEIFTTERAGLSKNLLAKKASAAAYLGGFHLANAARLQMLLDRTERHTSLKKAVTSKIKKVVWNDFGCGTGALAQTMAHKFKTWKPDITADIHLTDTTATLLDIAEKSTRAIDPESKQFKVLKHKKAIEETNIDTLAKSAPDDHLFGYSLGYVWNELKRNQRAQRLLTELFLKHVELDQQAMVVILEPANQVIAREAMQLRDTLVAGGYVPLYPCPSAGSCPMLKRTRDWCYSEGTWSSPALMQKIEQQVGIDRTKFSTAAYLFVSPKLAREALPSGKLPPVVVGRPQKVSTKGVPIRGFEFLVCNGDELTKKPGAGGKSFLLRGQRI